MAFSNEQHRRRYAEDAQYRARKLAANREYRAVHRARLNLLWWERWRSDAELREQRRVRRMEKKYGLPAGAYRRMLAEQNGLCAICKKKRKLCIDHDHVTGQVRQLLCNRCNIAIGLLDDDADLLRAGGARADPISPEHALFRPGSARSTSFARMPDPANPVRSLSPLAGGSSTRCGCDRSCSTCSAMPASSPGKARSRCARAG